MNAKMMSSKILLAALSACGVLSAASSNASAAGTLSGAAALFAGGPVIVEYDTYVVGPRQALYDADWRLRNAQVDVWRAQEDLDAARRHEGEVALAVDDQEALVAKYGKDMAVTEDAIANAKARVSAYEKRAASAHEDLEAARTLHDDAGMTDAGNRIRTNETNAAAARAELDTLVAHAPPPDVRARIADAQAQLPHLHNELAIAQDQTFAAHERLDAANQNFAIAMHDRDEALWVLHRDEIYAGRSSFEVTGFNVDFAIWGGRPPRDIEVVHAYYVHPASYWVEHPVEVQTRIVEVDRVREVTVIRDVERRHEPGRIHEIEVYETRVPPEARRAAAERMAVEHQRFVAERTERAAAIAEHRAPRVNEAERAEVRAAATRARAESQATRIEARADARAERTEARADAKAERTEAHADAQATRIEARADAKAKVTEARADAKAKETEANADAKAKVTEARADARTKEAEAHADAKSKEEAAKAQREQQANANSRAAQRSQPSGRDSNSGRDSRASSSSSNDSRYGGSRDSSSNSRGSSSYGNSRGSNNSNGRDSRNGRNDRYSDSNR